LTTFVNIVDILFAKEYIIYVAMNRWKLGATVLIFEVKKIKRE